MHRHSVVSTILLRLVEAVVVVGGLATLLTVVNTAL